ncbi:MAG: exodeoxyribonuclease III [Abditibacteriota bacterium]|nr:exodeoxyribonuclease III [Abditibacteriota bacterium]
MKIATFNANSVRNRLEVILAWMEEERPDLLCVQETKCQDKDFPAEAIEAAGLKCAFWGQKTFNGVALISPHELEEVTTGCGDPELDEEARFISARIGDALFVNTYIPQGQTKDSPKFASKLKYLERMYDYFAALDPESPTVWCGDFNIAMTDIDVYDPDVFRGGVNFCEEEQSRLERIMDLGMTDTFRLLHPEEQAFTFWDYRIPAALRRKMGWRLDYIMASAPLARTVVSSWVDPEPRKKPKSSDHTFLVTEFDYHL